MAAVTSQSISALGTTPVPITPAASDTIAVGQFGASGCVVRLITTGTATDFAVTDPGVTALGNPGDNTPLTCPATGVRMAYIPRGAVDGNTLNATITFSGARTGVTYELYRI